MGPLGESLVRGIVLHTSQEAQMVPHRVLPRKLGIDLQYRKASCKPWLTNITEGLVLRWNQAPWLDVCGMLS